MPLLQLEHVSKKFGQVVVADDINFELEEGEAVGIVGPNGAGKTSLFGIISGDVRLYGGQIHFVGQALERMHPSVRCRSGIGRTYQVPRPFENMTVFENTLVGSQQGAVLRGRKSHEAAFSALERTGLSSLANRAAGSLTLMQRKRLELARALATQPRLLLLDEIAGGLTDLEVTELTGIIRSINAEGVTILWIEHVVRALLSTVDRLLCLASGALVADGEPRAVLASEAVRRVYLGDRILNEAMDS